MNKNYVMLVVPFVTKNYKSSKENVHKVKGKCNFVIFLKDKSIVKQFIELEEANYRVTDCDMIKTVGYWNNKDVRLFRKTFIKNDKPKKEKRFESLNNKEIESINYFFKNESNTTVLKQLSYLSGSNASGAEKNSKATPLKCIDKNYLSFNFYNPLKKYKINNHLFESDFNFDSIKIISLSDVINSNQYLENFKEEFYKYNWMYINLLEDEETIVNLNKKISLLKSNNDKQKNVEKLFLTKVNDIYDLYNKKFYNDSNEYKRQLRSIYKSWTSYLVSIDKLKDVSQNKYVSTEVIEAAHIIGFSFLISSNNINNWKLAVNGNNVIFIESNFHKMFDKNIITFNPNNRKIVINENYPEKKYIEKTISVDEIFLINELSDEQIKNLEINFNYWLKNNKNMN
ncbi:MAG4270 family putative restriction endonuclease [Malacoplasma iowae]|uniref:MAG4270 family putative restriction endonuclease n=1 Tax=Malacoplasma iowae TaxID=2116 RepID=UPI002A187A37|nr:HNH endonuclease [Malacoplasma iowae]WPL39430.1 hypothetical protein QX183_02680 [Malacoplasma iowae]